MNSSRGVNARTTGTDRDQEPGRRTPVDAAKDASATPAARHVPAPLLAQPVLWAIATTAAVLWLIPILFLLKETRP